MINYKDVKNKVKHEVRLSQKIEDLLERNKKIIDRITKIGKNIDMIDDIDRRIISYLQYDGRMPFTQIAEQLGVAEGTVRRRVKQLIEDGHMQIVAIAEPRALGFREAAMIGITVQANRIGAVADKIAQLPEVTYLFQAAGEFDLFVEVYCQDRESFVSFLNNKLHNIPGIERTQSFVILKMHKLSYRWGEAEPIKIDHSPTILADNQ